MADSLGEPVSHTVSRLFYCITGVYSAKSPKTYRLPLFYNIRKNTGNHLLISGLASVHFLP